MLSTPRLYRLLNLQIRKVDFDVYVGGERSKVSVFAGKQAWGPRGAVWFGYLKFWREILIPGARFNIYPNLQYDEMGRHFIMLIIYVE